MKKMKMNQGKASSRGFTLIELAIVIAIIGILVAIAVPSYENYMRKVTRKKMTAKMQEVALLLEKNYAICSRYDINCVTRAAYPAGAFNENIYPNDGRAWRYNMQVFLREQEFIIVANPFIGPNASTNKQRRDNCGILTLDDKGIQYAGGAANNAPIATSVINANVTPMQLNYAGNINNNFNCWN